MISSLVSGVSSPRILRASALKVWKWSSSTFASRLGRRLSVGLGRLRRLRRGGGAAGDLEPSGLLGDGELRVDQFNVVERFCPAR